MFNTLLTYFDIHYSVLILYILRGENQKGVSEILGEIAIYILYQMKAFDELFLLPIYLKFTAVSIFIAACA